MREQVVIFVVAHVVSVAACLLIIGAAATALYWRRHSVLAAIIVWVTTEMALHVAFLLQAFKVVGAQTVVTATAIDSAASLVVSVYLASAITSWLQGPTVHELRKTTDAMAKTITSLTEDHQ